MLLSKTTTREIMLAVWMELSANERIVLGSIELKTQELFGVRGKKYGRVRSGYKFLRLTGFLR
jgi:hypothetical protein